MILRTLASLVVLGLLLLNRELPVQPFAVRGPEKTVRQDVETKLAVGVTLPEIALKSLDGRVYTREALAGQSVLLVFERSLDWCAPCKVRLLDLRKAFAGESALTIVWVMSDTQIGARTTSFIAELGLAEHVLFLVDERSQLIRELGILRPDPAPFELGTPHPTTLLLDRRGQIRFLDVREDRHHWLDPALLRDALTGLD